MIHNNSNKRMNSLLAICIPTFNRGSLLGENLDELIKQITPYSIPIFISDNASTDNTQIILNEALNKYPYIFYERNVKNIGMDRNFEKVLKMATTRYAWLLGDDDMISSEAIGNILSILDCQDYDLLVLNGGHENPQNLRVSDIQTKIYTSSQQLFVDLGWHMTWISCLIFNTKNLSEMNFEKYYDSYFVHIGAIFDYLGNKPYPRIMWDQGSFFYSSSKAVFSWSASVLLIFSDHWMSAINSLGNAYSHNEKRQCILNHGKKTRLFTYSGFLNLRAKAYINLANVLRSKNSLKLTSSVPVVMIILITLIPVWPLQRLRGLYKRYTISGKRR